MSKTVKIVVVIAVVVVVSISLFYTYKYFTTKWAYQNNVDVTQAQKLLEAATINASDELIIDDAINNANANKGTVNTATVDDYLSNDDFMNLYDQYKNSGYNGSYEDWLMGN